MIHVTQEVVASAFGRFADHERYGGEWFDDFQGTIDLYAAADRAFAGEDGLDDFQYVYKQVGGAWQAFRGGGPHWSLEEAYRRLKALRGDLRDRCLSQLDNDDWSDVWHAIQAVQDIKQNKSGPSLVAISKFLHFWNPRLFVIFDAEVVENFVFGHKWLGDQLKLPPVAAVQHLGLENNMRLATYLRVLVFTSDLIRTNPVILSEFAARYKAIGTYEATAVEWFLLGLVEIPPAGVEIE